MGVLSFLAICISLYSIISRKIRQTKQAREKIEAVAEQLNETNRIVSEYRQIADTLGSDCVLLAEKIEPAGSDTALHDCFIFLSPEGISYCTSSSPSQITTISYKNIKATEYSPLGKSDDPIKILQSDCLLFIDECYDAIFTRSTTVYLADEGPHYHFNEQSILNHNDFFAELEKNINLFGAKSISDKKHQEHLQIAAKLGSEYVLRAEKIYFRGLDSEFYDCFIFLTQDGISFFEKNAPQDIANILYKNIKDVDYVGTFTYTTNADPIDTLKNLWYISIEATVNDSDNGTVEIDIQLNYLEFEEYFRFNEEYILNHGNFFTELDKNIHLTENKTIKDIADKFK